MVNVSIKSFKRNKFSIAIDNTDYRVYEKKENIALRESISQSKFIHVSGTHRIVTDITNR